MTDGMDKTMLGNPLQYIGATQQIMPAVLGCTAFENGDGEPPFVIEFDVGVARLEPGQTAADALEVAAQLGQLQAG